MTGDFETGDLVIWIEDVDLEDVEEVELLLAL